MNRSAALVSIKKLKKIRMPDYSISQLASFCDGIVVHNAERKVSPLDHRQSETF